MLQIGVELISAIGLCGKFTRGVKRVPEVRRGSESFCFACEIQVEPEEGMISEIPECWVIRLFLIAPEAFSFQCALGQASRAFSSISMAAPNCCHRAVCTVVSIGCSAITGVPFFSCHAHTS